MSKLGNIWKTMLAGGAGVAALAALNAAIQRNASEPDDSALGGEAHFFRWKHGRVFYKTSGAENPGSPLVFIHGVGAGASSFMWRKNFDDLARDFRVYAFDLLGFGFSDKPAAASYSADLYVDLITDFIREVSGYPVNIIASSRGRLTRFEWRRTSEMIIQWSSTDPWIRCAEPAARNGGAAFYDCSIPCAR